jgi:hypothetical protein
MSASILAPTAMNPASQPLASISSPWAADCVIMAECVVAPAAGILENPICHLQISADGGLTWATARIALFRLPTSSGLQDVQSFRMKDLVEQAITRPGPPPMTIRVPWSHFRLLFVPPAGGGVTVSGFYDNG